MIEFVLLALLLQTTERDLVLRPQTEIEMYSAEWAATEIVYDKAPMDAELGLEEKQHARDWKHSTPHGLEVEIVSADEPLRINSAVFTEKLNQLLEVQLQGKLRTGELIGVWATFNPQFQIGKNIFSWSTDICNYTQAALTYDGAMISQIGEMSGNLSRVSPAEAENEANAWRNKTLPVEGVDGLTLAGHWLTIIGAAGVFAVSPHGLAIMALSTKLGEDFANWLKTKEPISFLQRFPVNTWLTGTMMLSPRSCIQDRVLFSRRVKRARTFSAQLP